MDERTVFEERRPIRRQWRKDIAARIADCNVRAPERGWLVVLAVLAGVGFSGMACAADQRAEALPASTPKASAKTTAAKSAKPALTTKAVVAPAAVAANASALDDARRGFSIAPPPAWVLPILAEPVPAALPRAPVQVPLVDRQYRLNPLGTERYVHAVRQIVEAAGLEPASQIEVEFDPTWQRLVLHRIDLIRNAQRIDKLDASKVKLLHREPQLERQIIDGRMTASLVLDDIRVGDQIEWAYSLIGDNPVFAGKFVDQDWMQSSSGPTAVYQFRLLAPPERQVRHLVGDPAVQIASQMVGGLRETTFRRTMVAQFRFDPMTPGGTYLKDQLQLSEFADWAEVAGWAEKLFARATKPGPEVVARAQALRSQALDSAQRLRLALDWVQTEVRYFGTEIGPNSHQPAVADDVLKQRFGDCKDKTALLAALLQSLEITATPVLVSTRYTSDVQLMLPSPLAFDHAIASVELDGKRLWLDSTRSLQTGVVDERQSRGLGFGLLTRADTGGLSAMPGSDDALRVEAQDSFSFGKLSEAATLEARQTFHGELAESVRAARAAMPVAEFDKQVTSDQLRAYTGLAPDGPAVLTEEPSRNAVTVTQRFTLPSPWRFPQQRQLVADFALLALMSPLRLPDQNPRNAALRLGYAGVYRQTVEFKFAEPTFSKPSSGRFDDANPSFRFSLRSEGTATTIRLDAELQILPDRIEAADFNRHRDAIVKLWPRLASNISVSALTLAQADGIRAKFVALDDDLKRGKLKAGTQLQRDALAALVLLNEQLAGDRLAPKLRAEALIARGQSLDHVGRLSLAQADFEQAIALDPQNADAHASLGVNAVLRRADAEAIVATDGALRLNPSDLAPRSTRAWARYFQRDYAGAEQELRRMLASRTEVERSYPQLWLYLTARQQGADGLAAIKTYSPSGAGLPNSSASKPAWPYPVLAYFQGLSSFDDALAATREGGKPDAGRQCELYFFAAQKALLDGDTRLARAHLQASIRTDVSEFVEHAFAQRELARLDLKP